MGDSVNLVTMWAMPAKESPWFRNALSIVIGSWFGGWLSGKFLAHLEVKRGRHIAHANSYKLLGNAGGTGIEMTDNGV